MGCCLFFFFKQKTAYEISLGLVGSEMCIRDRLEEVIRMFVGELFVGADIKETATFRVTRDMDMDLSLIHI
ncbi:polyphosphate kinase [Lactobacillus casei subsp. casei ATCC 393] [Lacticaseibacillus rhamnosus]|nr:polyphosphate kinase [Lactobacillus casei subsp. casei ATCC 393] [Lacticaseibacillus rhamnosus]